jgi:Asp-tRNA(Asn)/Glu-tRNA(Gln) amidotransferase A subunit family amidase
VSTPLDGETLELDVEPVAEGETDVVSSGAMKRRQFIRMAAAAAAATSAVASSALAQVPPTTAPAAGAGGGGGRGGGGRGGGGGGGGGGQPAAPPIPLENGEAPAITFQAYPGGTGALYEKILRERGPSAFERKTIEVAPWGNAPVPTNPTELAFLPAHRIGALIKERKISSMDITEIYLERFKRYNDQLLAAVTVLEGRAREEAQQADIDIRNGNWRGPLHGVPWGVKDLFAAKGGPTTWGSRRFENQMLDYDSEIIVRLHNAGAVLIAKLATGEYAQGANWFRGQTKNPWNPATGSGGSSAGPGSGTAGGLVGFSIGTETSGSIVGPSTTCGLSALRTSFGTISRHGGMVLSYSQDRPGPMCRSILDAALVMNILHGVDPKDPATVTVPFEFKYLQDLRGIRIGVPATGAPEAFVQQLRDMGATVSQLPELPNINTTAIRVEGAAAMDYWVTEAREKGEDPGNRFGVNGREDTALDYLQGQRRRLIVMQQWEDLLEDFDVMIGLGGTTNSTGHPAVVVPTGFGPRPQGGGGGGGRGGAAGGGAAGGAAGAAPATPPAPPTPGPDQPLCTTIFGKLFADDMVLSVAHAYQTRHDYHLRRPPQFG